MSIEFDPFATLTLGGLLLRLCFWGWLACVPIGVVVFRRAIANAEERDDFDDEEPIDP